MIPTLDAVACAAKDSHNALALFIFSTGQNKVAMEEETRGLERVRVAVRVRPRNAREENESSHHSVDVDTAAGQIYVCKKKSDLTTERDVRCSYDRVFPVHATQSDVFEYVQDAVQQVAQGFNCTIFAYGQTGTGKTHTMLGRDLEKLVETLPSREEWGVIPRAVESLFEELASIARHGAAAAIVHCSYMQLYNNEVYDLLQENKSRMKEPLAVREMIKGNDKQIYVSGLSEFRVTNVDETLALLRLGNKNRTIRATEYNEKSSRSHALLQLSAEVESRGAEGPTTIIRRAKLSLVDLAGSEKWDTDISMGVERCKELTSINQSLSALGNVISALSNPKRTHVPYRDSKLTRLLQDSLGGNTRTTVIATISPDASAIDETLSTLQFADRAKRVTLRVKVNEMVDDAILLAQARREIARLKLLLKKNASQEQLNELEQKVTKLTKENAALTSENKRLKQAMAAIKKERKVESPSTVMAPQPSAMEARLLSPRPVMRLDDTHRPLSSSRGATPVAQVDASCIQDELNERWWLEEIQSERRALEQELEQIEHLQTPRRLLNDNNGVDDDDRCPMCRRIIDDHTDDELDACIEQETALVTNHESPEHPAAARITVEPSHPPKTQLPVRKPLTPRTATVKKPTSPYLQNLYSIPHAPMAQSGSLTSNPTMARQRRSVRDLAHAGNSEGASEDTRPSTAGSNGKTTASNRPLETTRPQLTIPIVHLGTKSVKALKKFQASSPYNAASKPKPKGSSASPPRSLSNNHTRTNTDPQTDHITGSLRDIGLSLMIYKFRYDCWYPCTIVGFDSKRRLHCCQYEYGDKQWQDLTQNKLKIVGRSE